MNVPLLDLKEQNLALRPEIEAALGRVLDTNGFILGGEVAELERELAVYCGTKYAIGCASGSDAILLALMALDVGNGDEVITTPYSFFATVSAITRLGAVPVFVDIDRATYNLDVEQIEAKITPRTKAIIPVHLYGRPANLDDILKVADDRGIPIIEDACQAHGARWRGKRIGGFGLAAAFSFYPGKNLGAYGEGGALTTNDARVAERVRILRDHGQGLDRIGAEHYRVLRLPPVTRRGDARSLQRPYTMPQYAPKPAPAEPR